MSRMALGIAALGYLVLATMATGCADDCHQKAVTDCETIHPEKLGESWDACVTEAEIRCQAGEEL